MINAYLNYKQSISLIIVYLLNYKKDSIAVEIKLFHFISIFLFLSQNLNCLYLNK